MIGSIFSSIIISPLVSLGFLKWFKGLFSKKEDDVWYEKFAKEEIETEADWIDGFIDEPALHKEQILSVHRNQVHEEKVEEEPMIKSPELESVATSVKMLKIQHEAENPEQERIITTQEVSNNQPSGSMYTQRTSRNDDMDAERKRILEEQRLGFVSIHREAPKQNKQTPSKKKF